MTRKDTLSHAFIESFAQALGEDASRVLHLPQVPAMLWRHGEGVHALRLLFRTWPDRADPHAPEIVRISVNHTKVMLEPADCRRLGLSSVESSAPMGTKFRLEWTVLGEQLVDFAPFIAAWVWMKMATDHRAVLPPPHPCYIWGTNVQHIDYAWSIAAWQASHRHRAQEEHFLPIVSVLARPAQVALAAQRSADALL
jgi:hypothetical protein